MVFSVAVAVAATLLGGRGQCEATRGEGLDATFEKLEQAIVSRTAVRLDVYGVLSDLIGLNAADGAEALPLVRRLAELASDAWSATGGDPSPNLHVCHGAVYVASLVATERAWLLACADGWRDRPLLAACAIEALTTWIDEAEVQSAIERIAIPFHLAKRCVQLEDEAVREVGGRPFELCMGMSAAFERVTEFRLLADAKAEEMVPCRWDQLVTRARGFEMQGEWIMERVNQARSVGESHLDLEVERDARLLLSGVFNRREAAAYRRLLLRESALYPNDVAAAIERINECSSGERAGDASGNFGNHRFAFQWTSSDESVRLAKFQEYIPRQRAWLIDRVCHPNVRAVWDLSEHPIPRPPWQVQSEQAELERQAMLEVESLGEDDGSEK